MWARSCYYESVGYGQEIVEKYIAGPLYKYPKKQEMKRKNESKYEKQCTKTNYSGFVCDNNGYERFFCSDA